MKEKSISTKIFVAIILGALAGLMIKNLPAGYIKDTDLLGGIIKIVGTGFVNLIKMLVVPLVFVSLVCGAFSMGDINKIGRIGAKTIVFYLATTAVAITLALIIGKVINPGVGVDMSSLVVSEPTIGQTTSIVDTLLNIIPSNPIQSLASGEMLQIILFALLLGVSIGLCGEKANSVKKIFESFNEVFMMMVTLIMKLAPYGVFALMANTFATVGFEVLLSLFKYTFAVLFALVVQGLVVYMVFLKSMSGLNPRAFISRFKEIAAVAFSVSSSNAVLPLTIDTMKSLGVSESIASFTLPLGATVNMDGTAIMQGVACIFISQLYGIDLDMSALLTIIATATLASIGTAGVPGVGLITLSMVLTSVGLPIEGVGIIMGVDRLLDMARTVVNIMGDCVCTLIVSKSENELDVDKYYGALEGNEKGLDIV